MTAPLLHAQDVTARIPRRRSPLLNSVSLTIRGGESVAIVGRSGSGKTTLLSILGLLQPPDAGEVMVRGTPTSRLSDTARARLRRQHIGFVFQDYALIRELSVTGNLEMPLDYGETLTRRERILRIGDALAQVGLAGRERERPSRLSGGEQQRVAIARALVTQPSVILADEPTGALDSHTGDEIFSVLSQSVADGERCLVVVTHDPLLAAMTDRIVDLSDGALHQSRGPRDEAG